MGSFFSKMEKTLYTKVLWYKIQGRNYGRNNGKWLQWTRTRSILGEFRKRKRKKRRRKRKWDVTRKLFLNLGMILAQSLVISPRLLEFIWAWWLWLMVFPSPSTYWVAFVHLWRMKNQIPMMLKFKVLTCGSCGEQGCPPWWAEVREASGTSTFGKMNSDFLRAWKYLVRDPISYSV